MHIAGQLQITNAKVLVPRTLVFGLEEAKASPWNVACFRSVIKHNNVSNPFINITMLQVFYNQYKMNIGSLSRIPAVVQTDSGILLAFAEVKRHKNFTQMMIIHMIMIIHVMMITMIILLAFAEVKRQPFPSFTDLKRTHH